MAARIMAIHPQTINMQRPPDKNQKPGQPNDPKLVLMQHVMHINHHNRHGSKDAQPRQQRQNTEQRRQDATKNMAELRKKNADSDGFTKPSHARHHAEIRTNFQEYKARSQIRQNKNR